jgi:hypothetical protein
MFITGSPCGVPRVSLTRSPRIDGKKGRPSGGTKSDSEIKRHNRVVSFVGKAGRRRRRHSDAQYQQLEGGGVTQEVCGAAYGANSSALLNNGERSELYPGTALI